MRYTRLWTAWVVAASAGTVASAASLPGDTTTQTTYFRAENVAASFAHGAVLLAKPGDRYMIHTSRRVAAGMAEVHAQDTDLIYVLEGSATFVTGGTVVDGKSTAPDEIRGKAIADGETRTIAKGDVIVVPNGVPHWFKEVRGPLLYYTVKIR